MSKKSKILIIGESCKDVFNYGYCERLCPEAPVPVFNPISSTENAGMAGNVYRNVSSLGASAVLFTNANWEIITKTRFIDGRTNHMFMRLDNNDKEYGRSNIREKNINFKSYDGIIISDYNKGWLSEEDIEYVAEKHDNVFLDTKKVLGKWCSGVRFIKINNHEYEKTKHTLSKRIEQKLIITMGAEGCKYREKVFPVDQVEIKDTSGAGDTFISALAISYLKNNNIEQAILFASDKATQVVQRRGVSTI